MVQLSMLVESQRWLDRLSGTLAQSISLPKFNQHAQTQVLNRSLPTLHQVRRRDDVIDLQDT